MDTKRIGSMGRKRRIWSAEEKRSICLQASAPGVSVAQVARRYSMNANLIFNWLRDGRFAPVSDAGREAVFLPVEVSRPALIEGSAVAEAARARGGRVRIDLAGGHSIVVEGDFDGDALGRLLKAWLP
jgi:transposase